MKVETIQTAAAVIVRPQGRLDAEAAPELEGRCLAVVAEGKRSVILDLAGVDYISSAGLGTILAVGKRLDKEAGRLIICGLQPRLKQIFQFAGFDGLFPVVATVGEAETECVSRGR